MANESNAYLAAPDLPHRSVAAMARQMQARSMVDPWVEPEEARRDSHYVHGKGRPLRPCSSTAQTYKYSVLTMDLRQ